MNEYFNLFYCKFVYLNVYKIIKKYLNIIKKLF